MRIATSPIQTILPSALAVALVALDHAAGATYSVHHRILPGSWSQRGLISTNAGAEHGPQHTFSAGPAVTYKDTTGRSQPWEGLNSYESASSGFYQIAVTPGEKGTVDDATPITLARVCQLATAGPESITLHLSDKDDEAIAISYDLPGLDAGQLNAVGCPKDSRSAASREGVEVYISRPQPPLTLLPPQPPPTKPDGTPLAEGEEPPKEKSFFAKYWMYILPVVLLMVIPTEIADANNEEAENGGGGDGNPFESGVQKGQSGGKR